MVDRELKPGWEKKLAVQVSFTSSDGQEKVVSFMKKAVEAKWMIKFKTRDAGKYEVRAVSIQHHYSIIS